MKVRPLILTALAAATATATFSTAAMAEPTNRSSVSYSDLDLTSEAGRTELAKRFDQAALEMCGVADAKSMKGKAKYCYESTSKSMKARVATILTKHDEARGG